VLGRLLERIFPGPPVKGAEPVPWSPLAPRVIPAPAPKPTRGWLDPPAEPPPRPLDARGVELTRFASALDAVARRGYERLYAAAPMPEPGPEAGPAKLREHALRDVHDRVKMACLGEVQNQRPELALEYRKAFDVFNALWKMMQSIDPRELKGRRKPDA
jgi:hypothetical protein